jgi:hypothetical protein
MIPDIATTTPAQTVVASLSPDMHDPPAPRAAARVPSRSDVGETDDGELVTLERAVDPVVLARVTLQAQLQYSITRDELRREKEKTKALELLVRQLTAELHVAQRALAVKVDGFGSGWYATGAVQCMLFKALCSLEQCLMFKTLYGL